jgi:hypothetical protein
MFFVFYSCEAQTKNYSDITLVGSTPGEEQIKSLLTIPADTKVDFIRWNIILKDANSSKRTFSLSINYGEGLPNTPGFINGGEIKSLDGEYTVSHVNGNINLDVYHLVSRKLPVGLSIVKVNDNIYHFLTLQKQLMIGTGGWSYTLNRKEPLTEVTSAIPTLIKFSELPRDTAQIIFEGRTPCQEIARENKLSVIANCYKLKWKLVLNKDPKTSQPTTYALYSTMNRQAPQTGKWIIKKGVRSNSDAIIYQLDPDKPEQSISLLLGDENVLFFLNKQNQFLTGNADFSYTLNRRRKN